MAASSPARLYLPVCAPTSAESLSRMVSSTTVSTSVRNRSAGTSSPFPYSTREKRVNARSPAPTHAITKSAPDMPMSHRVSTRSRIMESSSGRTCSSKLPIASERRFLPTRNMLEASAASLDEQHELSLRIKRPCFGYLIASAPNRIHQRAPAEGRFVRVNHDQNTAGFGDSMRRLLQGAKERVLVKPLRGTFTSLSIRGCDTFLPFGSQLRRKMLRIQEPNRASKPDVVNVG